MGDNWLRGWKRSWGGAPFENLWHVARIRGTETRMGTMMSTMNGDQTRID